MKTARIITSVLVMSLVLACSFVPVVSAATSPGKTVTSTVTVGDVTMKVSVHGVFSDNTASDTGYYYRHVYNVTLTNNTNTFQVADTNYFNIDLYSGTSTAFTNSSSNPLAGWSSSVVEYSDNMTAPNVTFYGSGDYAGHVLVKFYDSDLLVLNPNEVRTYSFTIDYIQSPKTKEMLNGNVVYGYFTYSGNVSFYARPESFTSQTINDFMSNNSLPDSVIAYLAASYNIDSDILSELLDQGISLDDIISILSSHQSTFDYPVTSLSGTTFGYQVNTFNNVRLAATFVFGGSYVSDSNIDYDFVGSNSSTIFCVPEYVTLMVANNNDYSVSLPFRLRVTYNHSLTSTGHYLGYSFSYNSVNFIPNATVIRGTGDNNFLFTAPDLLNIIIPPNTSYSITYSVNRYFSVLDASSFSYSLASNSIIIDTFTVSEVTDDSFSDMNDIHDQEQQWYQENEQAIEDTGLANYQFTSSQISGLTAITTQFSQVWDVLGDWNLVYIFTLLLSFATYILRHRPSTKSQQRVAASEEYRYSNFMNNLAWRNEIRARWKAQDARYDKGDSSGASDLMRRNVRR